MRNVQGRYTVTTESFSSRSVPLFQRAQTLRAKEVYITPMRKDLACDYKECQHEDLFDIYAYVTPVYEGDELQGALVVAYDSDIWGKVVREFPDLPKTFFIIDAQGYYIWHSISEKITERERKLPSSFYNDFDETAAQSILEPAGSRVVVLKGGTRAYIYPVSPATEMIQHNVRINIPAPVTAPINKYFVLGFLE